MKLCTDRILTTHAGSLPRSNEVLGLLVEKENGELSDMAAFDRCLGRAVAAVVARQIEVGIDVVSDGETSKIGYSTYIKDRLHGFSGDSPRRVPADLDDYPDYMRRLAAAAETPKIKRPRCTGDVGIKDEAPLDNDIANFRKALDGSGAVEGFMNAASPGVIAVFLPNDHYPSHQAYLEALAEAMRTEYEAINRAGFVLQIDCPDLAMGRHTLFTDLSEADFLKHAWQQVEALNHALADVPAERCRLHLCWGNYEGPHTHDIDLDTIIEVVLAAKPMAISFEASNPRHAHEWTVWREANLPEDKVLIPGVIDSATNFVEHPELVAERICRFADIVGRERVLAGTDCGFGTFAGFGKVHPEICYAKLKALSEGAAIASDRLW
jgi:5-methyltetrahydropteroyltriglutamate--homocysteine methyltransferase